MACEMNKSWKCTLCNGLYSVLPTLVSHIRAAHSHEPGLCFTCGVDNCSKSFKNTNTYYKHVRKAHHQKYTEDTTITKKQLMSKSIASNSGSESMDDTTYTDDQGFVGNADLGEVDENEGSFTPEAECPDTVKIASGHILKLRCKAGVPQSLLPNVVEMNEAVVDSVLTNVSSKLMGKLMAHGILPDDPIATEVREVIDSHRDPLQSLHSVHCQTSMINTHYTIVNPVRKMLGVHLGTKTTKGVTTTVELQDEFIYIPFLDNLEQILHNDDIRTRITSSPHQLIGDKLANVCDGDMFDEQHPIFSTNPQAIQIVAYFDEMETANALGPRASKNNKLGAIYFMITNLEPHMRSKLDAIHLVALFECPLLERYCIDDILAPFCEDMKKLSKGHTFTIHGQSMWFQGALLAFIGDTPANNRIGGFKESVSKAYRKCRQCLATQEMIQESFVEEDFFLRTKQSHRHQCRLLETEGISVDERRHYSKVYGLNRRSVLQNLYDFDITKQMPEDAMHVLLEGIVPLHIGLFLNKIILGLKLVALDRINGAIQSFSYQYFESSSKPALISQSAIHDCNLTGKQTASQMRCLLHILPLILGDILEGNEFYSHFLLLHDICAVIFSPMISEAQVPLLRLMIQEYLHDFKTLYGSTLTPKCHFLVHFPQQILRFGPPIRLWAMRFEANHRVFKQWTRMTSYKNLCWSLAHKYQQQSAYITSQENFQPLKYSSAVQVEHGDFSYSRELTAMFDSAIAEESLYRCSSVEIHGTIYKKGCWLVTGTHTNMGGIHPQFSQVKDILSKGTQKTPFFVLTSSSLLNYIPYKRAHFVSPNPSLISTIHPSSIMYHEPLTSQRNGENYILKSRVDLSPFLEEKL